MSDTTVKNGRMGRPPTTGGREAGDEVSRDSAGHPPLDQCYLQGVVYKQTKDRQAVGPEFPIGLRISQWKLQDYAAKLATTPEEMEAWLAPLVQAGVDVFHCSQRRFWEPEFAGSDLNFAGWAKKLTGKTTITVGSVGLSGDFLPAFKGEASTPSSLDELLRRLDRGDFDLVAVGRALLADAGWARKINEGRLSELHGFSKEALSTLS